MTTTHVSKNNAKTTSTTAKGAAPKVVAPNASTTKPESFDHSPKTEAEKPAFKRLSRDERKALNPTDLAIYKKALAAHREAKAAARAAKHGSAPKVRLTRRLNSILKFLSRACTGFDTTDAEVSAKTAVDASAKWARAALDEVGKLPDAWKPRKGSGGAAVTGSTKRAGVGATVVIDTTKMKEKQLRGLEALVNVKGQLEVTRELDGKFIVKDSAGAKAIVPRSWVALAGDAHEDEGVESDAELSGDEE